LKNPLTIDEGLTAAGAKRIGEVGKADASQIGDKAQDKTIAKWMDDIWEPLGKELALSSSPSTEQLKEMQSKTIPILKEIDPDYEPPKDFSSARSGSSSSSSKCVIS
jgi:sulfite reductase alpha subunit-like flavoprotein